MTVDVPNKRRVLAIGLDGATWTVLKPLMDQGQLPNLKRLVEQGASGNLESTVPAHSAPAWTTFMTGVNPGKHGVYCFVKRVGGQEELLKLVSSVDIQAPTVFQLLSQAQRVVGSINLPITYPPFPVNGFIVSDDLLRPADEQEFTHPGGLFRELGWSIDDYTEGGVRDVVFDGFADALIAKCRRQVDIRVRLTQALMAHYPAWDFLTVVFTETDRMQHHLWHVWDPQHPRHNPAEAQLLWPKVLAFYQDVDRAVGQLAELVGPQTWVCVLSDHGFGPLKQHLVLNRILQAHGLLRVRTRPFHDVQQRLRGFLHERSSLYRAAKALVKSRGGARTSEGHGTNGKPHQRKVQRTRPFTKRLLNSIDWSRTVLYAMASTGEGASVNLRGREPRGVVRAGAEYERVRQRALVLLRQHLNDPETARPLPMRWWKREELYHGPYVEHAPDLMCENDSPYKINGQFHKTAFQDATNTTGWHRSEGILIVTGPGIRPATALAGARILDIAPTILHLLGLAVPLHMDGHVLVDAFDDGYRQSHPVQSAEAMALGRQPASQSVYSDEEAAKIEQRLGDLGYLE